MSIIHSILLFLRHHVKYLTTSHQRCTHSPSLRPRGTLSHRRWGVWPSRSQWSSRAVGFSPARCVQPNPCAPGGALPSSSYPEISSKTQFLQRGNGYKTDNTSGHFSFIINCWFFSFVQKITVHVMTQCWSMRCGLIFITIWCRSNFIFVNVMRHPMCFIPLLTITVSYFIFKALGKSTSFPRSSWKSDKMLTNIFIRRSRSVYLGVSERKDGRTRVPCWRWWKTAPIIVFLFMNPHGLIILLNKQSHYEKSTMDFWENLTAPFLDRSLCPNNTHASSKVCIPVHIPWFIYIIWACLTMAFNATRLFFPFSFLFLGTDSQAGIKTTLMRPKKIILSFHSAGENGWNV